MQFWSLFLCTNISIDLKFWGVLAPNPQNANMQKLDPASVFQNAVCFLFSQNDWLNFLKNNLRRWTLYCTVLLMQKHFFYICLLLLSKKCKNLLRIIYIKVPLNYAENSSITDRAWKLEYIINHSLQALSI